MDGQPVAPKDRALDTGCGFRGCQILLRPNQPGLTGGEVATLAQWFNRFWEKLCFEPDGSIAQPASTTKALTEAKDEMLAARRSLCEPGYPRWFRFRDGNFLYRFDSETSSVAVRLVDGVGKPLLWENVFDCHLSIGMTALTTKQVETLLAGAKKP